MFTALVFVATLTLLGLGYALFSSLSKSNDNINAERLQRECKRFANSGAMIGARDTLGE